MKTDTIRPMQIILIVIMVIGLKNHVTIIPSLLSSAGRDGWASVLLASLLHVPWLLLLLYIHKSTEQQDLFTLFAKKRGSIFVKALKYIIALFCLLLASFTMAEALSWIGSSFLPETPSLPLLIIFALLCLTLACSGLRTLAITNVVILFFVIIFGFFVAFANIPLKDYMLLMPFFEEGFKPTLNGLVYPSSGMIELVFLLLIQRQINGRLRFWHYLIMLGIITMLTIGPLVGAIVEFGPDEAAKQRYPAYEEWGLVTVGQYIDNLTFLSIYQWLTGAFIRVGFLLYIVIHLLQWRQKVKRTWLFIAPIFIIICLLLLQVESQNFMKLKGDYALPITFVFLFLLSIIFAVITIFIRKSARSEEI